MLVQREMERKALFVSEYSALRAGIVKASGSTDPMWSLEERRGEASAPVHRLDEPTGLSLSMVASPQCRFRFVRQNHCGAAAANFRMPLHPGVMCFLIVSGG